MSGGSVLISSVSFSVSGGSVFISSVSSRVSGGSHDFPHLECELLGVGISWHLTIRFRFRGQ